MREAKLIHMTRFNGIRASLIGIGLCTLAAPAFTANPTLAATGNTTTKESNRSLLAKAVVKQQGLQPIENCKAGACTLNYGSTAKMGLGTMKAYAFVENGTSIKEIGVLLDAAVLKGLPQNCGSEKPTPGTKWLICQASAKNPKGQMNDTMVTTLEMPKNVIDLANIEKLDISWLPFGHAPEKVWDKPQFDIHFPFRKPGGGQDTSRFYSPQVPQAQLPSGYMVLPGSGFHWDTEALQGHAHAADPKNSPEFAGGPFLANFLYITYNGKAIGYEVYASTKLLETKGLYTRNLEMPEYSPGTKNVPSKLKISYVPELNAYRVSLYDYKTLPAGYQGTGHAHGSK
jgi:hypothetical protein